MRVCSPIRPSVLQGDSAFCELIKLITFFASRSNNLCPRTVPDCVSRYSPFHNSLPNYETGCISRTELIKKHRTLVIFINFFETIFLSNFYFCYVWELLYPKFIIIVFLEKLRLVLN